RGSACRRLLAPNLTMSGRDKWRVAGIGPRGRKTRKVRPPPGAGSLRYGAASSFYGGGLLCGAVGPPPPSSVPPKLLESVGRHFGVSDGVLDVLVPEVMLQGPRVVAIIGQLEPTRMAKHVRVDREWHVSGFPEPLDEPVEARRASLG